MAKFDWWDVLKLISVGMRIFDKIQQEHIITVQSKTFKEVRSLVKNSK